MGVKNPQVIQNLGIFYTLYVNPKNPKIQRIPVQTK
jgi:hypothetical protein